MPPHVSSPALLGLHAIRLQGFADEHRAASRFSSDVDVVSELLLDFESRGFVTRTEFDGTRGWSLTARGRAENERQLAEELDQCGARPVVVEAHRQFLPLNARFQDAATRWQLRPLPGDPMAANDHTDFRWDDRVVETLTSVGLALEPLGTRLSQALARFDGYGERYSSAVTKVVGGAHRWVDGLGIDSCHAVWMQLHEDLLATLGLERSYET